MTSTTYDVTGMTCGHCVAAVTTEVGSVPGVTSVDVDLTTGRVTVEGDTDRDEVVAAIDEAGYALA